MRWDDQTAGRQRASQLPGFADVVTRTFDAPEAMSARFHEIHAKTALNRVPGAARLPFAWTVNPYRGCLHQCTYCSSGDLQVLLGDGRTRRMADLQVGDEIYGTQLDGGVRRFARTQVLDHWSSVKPAYRTTLADGTTLVTSGDHRLLTRSQTFKHVCDTTADQEPRPLLTTTDVLIGTDRFARTQPEDSAGQLDGLPLESSADLRVASIEPMGEELRLYDITTGTGDYIGDAVVHHNCFARPTHEYLGFDAGKDFDGQIVVKVNAPEVLRAELNRPSWRGEHVALGTNTDPYQWVEKRYGLTRGILEVLRDARNPCSVLTKSPLLLRDLDLFLELLEVTEFSACLSIPTLDERAWRATEPGSPNPRKRIEAVAALNAAGVPTGVLVAPLMPHINDAPEQVEAVVEACREAGAVRIGGQALFLRGSTKNVFMDWLRHGRPDLVTRYEELYGTRVHLRESDKRATEARLRDLTRRVPERSGPAGRFQRGAPLQRSGHGAVAMPPTARQAAPDRQGSLF